MASMILSCVLSFFCFKQKTAYEMRISDWSSDVCSSDLRHDQDRSGLRILKGAAVAAADSKRLPFGYRLLLLFQVIEPSVQAFRQGHPLAPGLLGAPTGAREIVGRRRKNIGRRVPDVLAAVAILVDRETRSEEHTSELQSLMRISYAVFCLK